MFLFEKTELSNCMVCINGANSVNKYNPNIQIVVLFAEQRLPMSSSNDDINFNYLVV